MKPGDTVEAVDASLPEGRKKIPFAKGQAFEVAEVRPGIGKSYVRLKGVPGFWNINRFEVRRG